MSKIMKIEIFIKDENEAQDLACELRDRGLDLNIFYTNGYGAPRQYAGLSDELPNYPAPSEGEIDGD